MADASYVRSSFIGGEYSQFIQGRTERPEYPTGLNVCLNSLPIETGAWVRRPGFRFVQTTRLGAPGRVIKFDFQQAAPYVMEFTDLHLRFFTGPQLVTSNDSIGVASISTANPAVVQTSAAVTWATGDQGFFTLLGASCPLLQNRVFSLTKIDTTHFSLTDAVTGATIDGSTLGVGTLAPATVINRALDITTVYNSGSWASLRSVQTESTAFLLHGLFAPYALTVTAQPTASTYAGFALNPAVFNDGPYLDPFTNGVWATPSAKSGIINLTLSFPAYSATIAYAKDAFVTYAGNNYRSLSDQNVNHQPDISPTFWVAVNAGTAISPNGFVGTDVGRLVRLFSEPDLWAPATVYAQNAVVSYNPNNLPGQTTYWSSLIAGNTGNVPGADLKNWQLMTQGGTSSPALWTWGKITSTANNFTNVGGSVAIGDMTQNGGLAAAFDTVISQSAGLSAALNHVFAFGVGVSQSFPSYVGKNYTVPGAQVVQGATVYPSSDRGFTDINTGVSLTSITFNLRGKNSAPASSSDGTILGTLTIFSNSTSSINIVSTNSSAWIYIWVEIISLYTNNTSFVLGSTEFNYAAEVIFTGPAGSGVATAVNMEIIGPPLLYTTPIRVWRLGTYSNTTGWPSCGTYSDGRLWLSGVVGNRIDASVANGIVGGTVDFAPTDQYGNVLASSAISYVFNSDGVNPIFWMTPDLQGVICGTKAGEWLVSAPTTGGITPFNISARKVTSIGCANIEPKKTEHTTIFVQKFGRKIAEYFADVFSGKFTAPYLTFTGYHLTIGGLQEIAYQQEKTPIVWARVANQLRGVTYRRDSLVTSQGPTFAGWHRHLLGSGRVIESMTVGPSLGGNLDALTIVSNDPISNVRHVEILSDILDEGSSLAQAAYLDNAVGASSTSTSSTVPSPYGGLTLNGLWHLNGKTVTTWLGGLDCGDYTVSNGSITVPFGDGIAAGTANGLFTAAFVASFGGNMPTSIGFTYNSDAQIVRPATAAESGARSGPALGKKRRTMQYAVQLEGAQGVSFGTDFDHVDPARFRFNNDVPYTLQQQFTGVFWDALQDTDSFDSMICWRISRPYICNVTALGGFVQTRDR